MKVVAAMIMSKRRQLHGAVLVRLTIGRWVSLDPYMRNSSLYLPVDEASF